MYDGDSFFSLTMPGRIGLVLLCLALAVLAAGAMVAVTCRLTLPARLLVSVVFVWMFVWLSPQIFYLYYMLLFDQLPLQVVVRSPPWPTRIVQLLSFSDKPTLSHHATGLLGWSLIGIAVLGERAVPSARCRSVLGL